MDLAQAKATVQQTIEEHPHEIPLASVEVTDEKVTITQNRLVKRVFPAVGGVTVVPTITVLYFNNIGSTDLHQKAWFVIRVFDRAGRLKLRLFSGTRDQAERFLDALLVLSIHATT